MKKLSKKNKERIGSFLLVVSLIILLIIGYYETTSSSDKFGKKQCPYTIEGNTNASFKIMYIDSPYCVWCWVEEPILERLVKKKGHILSLEKYDIRYCKDIVTKYRILGTPSFVFSLNNGTQEYPKIGFIEELDFYQIICEITGNCD